MSCKRVRELVGKLAPNKRELLDRIIELSLAERRESSLTPQHSAHIILETHGCGSLHDVSEIV